MSECFPTIFERYQPGCHKGPIGKPIQIEQSYNVVYMLLPQHYKKWGLRVITLYQKQILHFCKLKEFQNNFKFDENGRKASI